MKLKEWLEYSEFCGFKTVGEAYDNIKIHATDLFPSEDVERELYYLSDEINCSYLKRADLIKEVLNSYDDGNG